MGQPPADGAVQPVGVDQIVARLDRLERTMDGIEGELEANERERAALYERHAVALAEHREWLSKLRSLSA